MLVSGHHANILKWQRKMALKRTLERRPELLETVQLNEEDIKILDELCACAADED